MERITRRAAFPQSVQVAAVLYMAFSPFNVYYSAEVRMYALLGFLTLAGVEAVISKQWARLGIIAAALAYTHNWGLLYCAALFVLALLTTNPRQWRTTVLPFAFAAVLWLPWGFTLLWQMDAINQSYWLTRVTPGLVVLQLHQMVWGMIYNPLASMLTFALLALGIYTMIRDDPRAAGLVLTMFFVPFLLGIIISIIYQPVMLFRAMAGISPFAGILALWPITRLGTLRAKLTATVFVAPLLVMAYLTLFTATTRAGAGDALEHIAAHWQPGDVIVATTDTNIVNLLPYTDKPVILLRECRLPLGGLTEKTRAAMGYDIRQWDDINAPRVWFLYTRSPLIDDCMIAQAETIIHQTAPALVLQDGEMVKAGLWLVVEKGR
jgi:uncharacterized membrane protein